MNADRRDEICTLVGFGALKRASVSPAEQQACTEARTGVFPIYWIISSAFLPTRELQRPEPTFPRSAARSPISSGC